MLRINNAKVCPNCDVLYDEPLCPSCSSQHGHPIREWLQPMNHLFFGGKYDAYKTCLDTVQEKPQVVFHSVDCFDPRLDLSPSFGNIDASREEVRDVDPNGIVNRYSAEGKSKHQPDRVNDQTRKPMEPERCVQQGCNRVDASHAGMDTQTQPPRHPFTKRFVRSGKELIGRMLGSKGSSAGEQRGFTQSFGGVLWKRKRIQEKSVPCV